MRVAIAMLLATIILLITVWWKVERKIMVSQTEWEINPVSLKIQPTTCDMPMTSYIYRMIKYFYE